MTEYLAPGVPVEETTSRATPIEGVDTSTAAFVGPTLSGPLRGAPPLLTSVAEFERLYGGAAELDAGHNALRRCNYVAHAVRAYFVNGGTRLYVARAAARRGRLPDRRAYAAALRRLARLGDVSSVAAPGYSARLAASRSVYLGIQSELLAHVQAAPGPRFAVLDCPPAQTAEQMREWRALVGAPSAALYYPWIVVADPLQQRSEIALPPSGAVCGIYARVDRKRGVWKAPAGEVVRGALRAERDIGGAEQELLGPLGVNLLRDLPGRGLCLWGAHTTSAGSDWKYVQVRRYVNYIQASVERGTLWAAFEPNGEPLWADVRSSVNDFLLKEWRQGALLGTKPQEAFFVRCDRSTMTQNGIDQGRLVCTVGIAVVRPAEFVIFRIGQWSGSADDDDR
jgi:phage tail sheath protein FI